MTDVNRYGRLVMQITSSQCRAARALLNWSQDQLSTNAQVARATITDFEGNVRTPIRNNMNAIHSALHAAGIEFISEEEDRGVGVRFRKIELEYSRNLKAHDAGVLLSVRYKGTPYTVLIPRDVIDDIDRTDYRTFEERGKAVERHFPLHLCTAENAIIEGRIADHDYIGLTPEKYPSGTF